MVKERIIANLKTLLAELAPEGDLREKWEEFLVSLAEALSSAGLLTERIKEPLANLFRYVDESSLIKGIDILEEKVSNLPLVDILKAVIEVVGEKRKETEVSIKELREILSELATPVIRIWSDVLLMPLIGTLDSDRAQSMAERILEQAANTRARAVIVDVTGVPMIDTIVGGYLIEMFNAVKLLGSDVILTGIKPAIAHTLVKLGVDFKMVTIKRDLEDALKYAIIISGGSGSDRKGKQKRGVRDEE